MRKGLRLVEAGAEEGTRALLKVDYRRVLRCGVDSGVVEATGRKREEESLLQNEGNRGRKGDTRSTWMREGTERSVEVLH